MARNRPVSSADPSPQKPNFISYFLNKLPVSLWKRQNAYLATDDSRGGKPEDFRSLPPQPRGGALPRLQGVYGEYGHPHLTPSISEPAGFISEFLPYRPRAFDESIDGLSLKGSHLNDGTLYHSKPPSHDVTPDDIELTCLDEASPTPSLHYFLVVQLHQLTWCDACGEFIWGLVNQCLRCSFCRFTCHHHCRDVVSIECPRRDEDLERGVDAVAAWNRARGDDEDVDSTRASSDSIASSAESSESFDSSDSALAAPRAAPRSPPQTRPKPVKSQKRVRPRLSNDLFLPTGGGDAKEVNENLGKNRLSSSAAPSHAPARDPVADPTEKKSMNSRRRNEEPRESQKRANAQSDNSSQSRNTSSDHHHYHHHQPHPSRAVEQKTAISRPILDYSSFESDEGFHSLLPDGKTMTKETLAELVTQFNKKAKALSLAILEDGLTVRGFIRVHLDLMRPVNISTGNRFPMNYTEDDGTGKSRRSTDRPTFHIPQDTVKNLHVTSETTVREVVEALLKKYAVTDHPKKFALFEKMLHVNEDGKHAISFRRLHDFEQPLLIFLCWGAEMLSQRKFVLQENETGEILWEAFTMPELNTFLRILDHEEEETKAQIVNKYDLYQRKLTDEITKREKQLGYSEC